jgi:large subunit ribosomal protein L24
MKIKIGDTVLITSGKDKGKKGKIRKILPKENRIIIDGINLRKKNVRAKREGEKGQIVEIAAPISASSVKMICTKCKQPTRVGYRIIEKNKYRICKKCNQEL